MIVITPIRTIISLAYILINKKDLNPQLRCDLMHWLIILVVTVNNVDLNLFII